MPWRFRHATLEEVTDFAWYGQMMRVNFFGILWCTRHALPHLKLIAPGLVDRMALRAIKR